MEEEPDTSIEDKKPDEPAGLQQSVAKPVPSIKLGRPTLDSKLERVMVIVACVAILGGSALFVYGEQSAGVGQAGAVNKLMNAIGLGIFSVGIIIVAIWLAKWLVAGFMQRSPSGRVAATKLFFKQLLAVVLNALVYGGVFVLALGALSALDDASIGTIFVVLITWAACIAVFVFYRKFRKRHKVGYAVVGYVAMPVVLLALGIAFVTLSFGQDAAGAIEDLEDGPKTADVLLVHDKVKRPAVWYAMVAQTDHILTFYTPDGERIVLEVPDSDIAQATVIDDYGDFVHLTYYPNTQVFCGAAPWPDGRQVFGEVFFRELKDEYGFDL